MRPSSDSLRGFAVFLFALVALPAAVLFAFGALFSFTPAGNDPHPFGYPGTKLSYVSAFVVILLALAAAMDWGVTGKFPSWTRQGPKRALAAGIVLIATALAGGWFIA